MLATYITHGTMIKNQEINMDAMILYNLQTKLNFHYCLSNYLTSFFFSGASMRLVIVFSWPLLIYDGSSVFPCPSDLVTFKEYWSIIVKMSSILDFTGVFS